MARRVDAARVDVARNAPIIIGMDSRAKFERVRAGGGSPARDAVRGRPRAVQAAAASGLFGRPTPAPPPGTPLFAQVRDRLRGAILAGEVAPGDRLPSEGELVERLGVSRITVRQALAELQTEGLVSTVNGKGSFVTRPGRSAEHGPLMGVLAAMRKRGHPAVGRLLAHRIAKASAEVAAEFELPPGTRLGTLTIQRLCDGEPFAVGTSHGSPELVARIAAEDLAELDVAVVLEQRLGLRIARTKVRVSAVAADARVARRLGCARGAPVLRIHTTSFDFDDHPVLYAVTDCRPDVMDYRVTLRR